MTPDTETFSTPPTTPMPPAPAAQSQPMAGRRPSQLQFTSTAEAHPEIQVEVEQDDHNSTPNLKSSPLPVGKSSSLPLPGPVGKAIQGALKSPCFVHSLLDKGASLSDWLKQQPQPHLPHPMPSPPVSGSSSEPDYDDEEEEEYSSSLTRQLAETAVGVREMSKQLGRARVHSKINNVLIITKARDNRLSKLTRELALMLMTKEREDGRGLVVYVDSQLRNSKRFDAAGLERDYPELFVPIRQPRRRSSSSTSLASSHHTGSVSSLRMTAMSSRNSSTDNLSLPPSEGQLRYWTSDMCIRSPHLFDFVVTLGGDGTVLFASWLFQRIVPPILPFALGSLGFLTNFDFADYKAVMDGAIDNGIRVNLRMRFSCTVYRSVNPDECRSRKAVKRAETGEILMKSLEKGGGWEALEAGYGGSGPTAGGKDKEIMCLTTRPVETFEVLNDLVIDRGPSPYVSMLELFGDEHHMTTVQGDGLTVSTPTGSTAYSLSAGGSLVHPEIPAILITPICPHTLSFRPMLLPDSMELRVCVPYNSRSTAWASFDGRGRVELKPGDHIKVTASKYPFPTVCNDKQSTDWFHSISRTFKWNERERQKSFVMVEEDAPSASSQSRAQAVKKRGDEGEEEEEEEEEKYDIDDSSPEAAVTTTANNNNNSNHNGNNAPSVPEPEQEGRGKGLAAVAARAINRDNIVESHFTNKSGYDSPDRFRVPHPHPPKVHFRHTVEGAPTYQGAPRPQDGPTSRSQDANPDAKTPRPGDTHSHSHSHSNSNSHAPQYAPQSQPQSQSQSQAYHASIEQDGRPHSAGIQHHHHHSPHYPHSSRSHREHHRDRAPNTAPPDRRAFAVWGQDESDSNTSDGEV
ncbi:ATP-NAD kinase [Rhizoctonia solani]|uniref:ATP-NAD kinase n=1 Tax=Rhizoctonia solani TaxID=456999 RepID=A0A8H8T224_9AGAM|nr:ATP-NAD kinase [Rhizoctonia solani]QRW25093.1 ATP-NAD kinase [Rhizoctonia solani]